MSDKPNPFGESQSKINAGIERFEEDRRTIGNLPRTIASGVHYQFVIRAFQEEYTATYEFGTRIFGDVVAHGQTINEAIAEMQYFFENHDAFKYLR